MGSWSCCHAERLPMSILQQDRRGAWGSWHSRIRHCSRPLGGRSRSTNEGIASHQFARSKHCQSCPSNPSTAFDIDPSHCCRVPAAFGHSLLRCLETCNDHVTIGFSIILSASRCRPGPLASLRCERVLPLIMSLRGNPLRASPDSLCFPRFRRLASASSAVSLGSCSTEKAETTADLSQPVLNLSFFEKRSGRALVTYAPFYDASLNYVIIATRIFRMISVQRETRVVVLCQWSLLFSRARLTMQRNLKNARLPSPAALAAAPFIVATAKPPHYCLGLLQNGLLPSLY